MRATRGQWSETVKLGASDAAIGKDDPAVRRAGVAENLIDASNDRGAVRAMIQSQGANGECWRRHS